MNNKLRYNLGRSRERFHREYKSSISDKYFIHIEPTQGLIITYDINNVECDRFINKKLNSFIKRQKTLSETSCWKGGENSMNLEDNLNVEIKDYVYMVHNNQVVSTLVICNVTTSTLDIPLNNMMYIGSVCSYNKSKGYGTELMNHVRNLYRSYNLILYVNVNGKLGNKRVSFYKRLGYREYKPSHNLKKNEYTFKLFINYAL